MKGYKGLTTVLGVAAVSLGLNGAACSSNNNDEQVAPPSDSDAATVDGMAGSAGSAGAAGSAGSAGSGPVDCKKSCSEDMRTVALITGANLKNDVVVEQGSTATIDNNGLTNTVKVDLAGDNVTLTTGSNGSVFVAGVGVLTGTVEWTVTPTGSSGKVTDSSNQTTDFTGDLSIQVTNKVVARNDSENANATGTAALTVYMNSSDGTAYKKTQVLADGDKLTLANNAKTDSVTVTLVKGAEGSAFYSIMYSNGTDSLSTEKTFMLLDDNNTEQGFPLGSTIDKATIRVVLNSTSDKVNPTCNVYPADLTVAGVPFPAVKPGDKIAASGVQITLDKDKYVPNSANPYYTVKIGSTSVVLNKGNEATVNGVSVKLTGMDAAVNVCGATSLLGKDMQNKVAVVMRQMTEACKAKQSVQGGSRLVNKG